MIPEAAIWAIFFLPLGTFALIGLIIDDFVVFGYWDRERIGKLARESGRRLRACARRSTRLPHSWGWPRKRSVAPR